MTFLDALLIFFAAMLGGGLNAVAGGGSFITVPALIFVNVHATLASATNALALWPGAVSSIMAYRKELNDQRQSIIFFGLTSLAGGVVGALLLIRTPDDTFVKILPFFMLFATLMFVYGSSLTKNLRERLSHAGQPSKIWLGGVLVLQFVIATYGGYFGGGLGILLLGTMSLMEMKDIHRMNALKAVLQILINGAAVVTFILRNFISWPHALVMVFGALIGGYAAASFARKLNPLYVRRFVIIVGCVITVYFFLKYNLGIV